jgi:TolB-like protein
LEAGAAAAPEPASSAAARRRSMLVLPFSDAGGDPVPGGLADAITEELIAGFGASYYFTVIGRGTAFGYRGRTPDLRQLGQEQDVRYVLDGTLRRFGGQVLISIHLQDTGSGSQLWADRFEMPLDDPAGLPRLVFARIQRNLAFAVNAIETRQPLAAAANRPDVTDLLIRGDAVWNRGSSPELLEATRALYARAVALDENSSAAQTSLGGVLVVTAFDGHSADREADLAAGERHLARALALNPQNGSAHHWRALALRLRWRFDEALAEYDLLIAMNKRVPQAIGGRGAVMLATC